MIHSLTQRIIQERGITSPNIFFDVDGPGTGNSAIVERIEKPKEGGILAYLIGYKYPYKGNPVKESVERIGIVKKNIMFFREAIIGNKVSMALLGILLMIPGISQALLGIFIHYFYRISEWLLYYELFNPIRYCTSVRELYRVFTILEEEKDETIRKAVMLAKDFFCMVIEQDSAYRFRFQDVMACARKKELIVGGLRQIREINRLFKVLLEREMDKTGISPRWKSLRNLFLILLISQSKLRRKVSEFFKEINLKEIRADKGDDYFNSIRVDYNFKGKSILWRIKKRKAIEGKNWVNFEELSVEMLKRYNYHFKGGSKI